jgi:hypothetical protein
MRHKKNLWLPLEKIIGQFPDFHIAAFIRARKRDIRVWQKTYVFEQRRESTGQALGGKGELKHVLTSCVP